MKKKFPWDCEGCPMLASWDMSADDITYKCLWSKNQIDECDRWKYAECPLEKHDTDIRNKTIAPFEREIENLNRAEWTEQNLACFVFRIQEIIEQMKGDAK